MGDNQLTRTRTALVSRLGEAATQVGLHRTPAQIYALLIMSENPLSLDDIAKELGVSKASVSIYARELTGLGVIRKVWAPETRRDTYEAETDLLKVIRLWLQTGVARRVAEAGSVLEEVERYLATAESNGEGTMVRVRERITSARALHGKVAAMLPFLPGLLGASAETMWNPAEAAPPMQLGRPPQQGRPGRAARLSRPKPRASTTTKTS